MGRCTNCGARVSKNYIRVRTGGGLTVPACPSCPDACLEDGKKHEYRG